jgi:uncharacterized protein (TIGR02594 family)
MSARQRKLGSGDPAMRFKTAFVFAAGSTCVLALSIADFRWPPPRNHVEAQAAHRDAGREPIMPRSIELPQEVRLPPLPPSRRGAAVSSSVAAGLVLVAEARRYLGTNPTHRKRLWCATFMNFILAKLGYAGTHSEAARSFLHYGRRLSGPRIGAIAMLSRGKDGGHVGVVTGIDAHRNPILISGNFNRRVGIGVYPRSRVIAYVMLTGAARLSHGSPTTAQPVQASVRRIASRWRRATPTPTSRRLAHRGMRRCVGHSDRCRRIAGIGLSASAAQARAEVQY